VLYLAHVHRMVTHMDQMVLGAGVKVSVVRRCRGGLTFIKIYIRQAKKCQTDRAGGYKREKQPRRHQGKRRKSKKRCSKRWSRNSPAAPGGDHDGTGS